MRLRLVRIIFNFVANAKNYFFSENSYKWSIISWTWIQKWPNRSILIHQVILLGPLRSLTLIIDLGSRPSGPPCFQEATFRNFPRKYHRNLNSVFGPDFLAWSNSYIFNSSCLAIQIFVFTWRNDLKDNPALVFWISDFEFLMSIFKVLFCLSVHFKFKFKREYL